MRLEKKKKRIKNGQLATSVTDDIAVQSFIHYI